MSVTRPLSRAARAVAAPLFAALLTLALALWGFAHQPVPARALAGAESVGAVAVENGVPTLGLTAYRLPDGSFPILCLGGLGDDDGSSTQRTGCDACRLAAAMALPDGAASLAIPAAWPAERPASAPVILAAQPAFSRAQPRAPPVA